MRRKEQRLVPTLLLLFTVCASAASQSAGDFRSKTTGNWGSAGSWQKYNGSSWATALFPPTSSDGEIRIRAGHTISVLLAVNVDQVVVDSGGVLNVAVVSLTLDNGAGVDLSVSGTFKNSPNISLGGSSEIEFNDGGVYEHQYSTSAGTIPDATWNDGSTCKIAGYTSNSSVPSGIDQDFYNFVWDCPSQSSDVDALDDTIKVRGNFSVASTGSGSLEATVLLRGTTQQLVSAAGDLLNTAALVINNAAGVVLDSDLSIDNLVFVEGNLYLADYDLTIGGTVTGAAATQCIVTENGSTGSVYRTIDASGSFQFPVAPTATAFNPITIALGSGDPTETFRVRVEEDINPAFPSLEHGVNRTWDISEDTPGGNNVTLTFQWTASEEGTQFTRNSASFYHYTDSISTWELMSSGTLAGSDPYTLTSDNTLSNFSRWSPGNSGGLPVEMVSLWASMNGSEVVLSWSTATEVDNAGWRVERKEISNFEMRIAEWKTVGFVEGAGTSSGPREYSFEDQSLAAWRQAQSVSPSTLSTSRLAYRLKQLDRSGSFTYSSVVEVDPGKAPKAFHLSQNYPNPFNPSTEISFTAPAEGRATLVVFNVIGQEVSSLFDGVVVGGRSYRFSFDASGLAAGLYFARLDFGRQSMMRKMLLVK